MLEHPGAYRILEIVEDTTGLLAYSLIPFPCLYIRKTTLRPP